MATKNILVTGGCGFVGANFIKKLCSERNDVSITVFDNLSNGDPAYISDTPAIVVEGDIRNCDQLKPALAGVDTVVHLAAYGSVVDSVQDPVSNFEMNVLGTFNVIKEASAAGVKRCIFSSTGGALIGDAKPPVSELSLPKPISPYGASKLCGEAYLNAFASSFNIETVALRFANVFGNYSGHKKGAITTFMKNIHQNKPITIYGDGNSSRDYLHAQDLADGIISALDIELQEPAEVFHLSSGREVTISELASEVIKVSGATADQIPIQYEDKRVGEVERNFADYAKANKRLNFSPKISLNEGLSEMWSWYQKNVF